MVKEEKTAHPDNADPKEIESEARSQYRFSLAEAIGRAGSDLLKGASPVTRRKQAAAQIEHLLEEHLDDEEGALELVLLRRFENSESLLKGSYDDPARALAEVIQGLLGSQESLRGFVRSVDSEWGRIYLERPFFQQAGEPAHADDPYSFSSVRRSLEELLAKLA